jgi:xanthine dehydrogenase accessory factor
MSLKNKKVVVIGGTSGIGLAIAQAAALQGAELAVASSSSNKVEEAKTSLQGQVEGYVLDVSNEQNVEKFFQTIGNFDHLVTSVGRISFKPFLEESVRELQAIIEEFEEAERDGKITALATVVKVKGSTYRQPGARMLMTKEGQMVGSLSGGCLENDVFEQAQGVMALGEPLVVKYDTTSDEDIVWGLGLGCNGIVEVLIERLPQERELNSVTFLQACLRRRQPGVLARVFYIEGQVSATVGDCWMLHPDGTVTSNITDAKLATSIFHDAQIALDNNQSTGKLYELPTGRVEVFIEVIQPPMPLVIFGAGHDAVPVVRFAKELGWHVTLVDGRDAYATKARLCCAILG